MIKFISNLHKNTKFIISESIVNAEMKTKNIFNKFITNYGNAIDAVQEKDRQMCSKVFRWMDSQKEKYKLRQRDLCKFSNVCPPPHTHLEENKGVVPEFKVDEDYTSFTNAKRFLESDTSPIRAHKEVKKVLDPKKRRELAEIEAEMFVDGFAKSIEFLRTVGRNYFLHDEDVDAIAIELNNKYTKNTDKILEFYKQNTEPKSWNKK